MTDGPDGARVVEPQTPKWVQPEVMGALRDGSNRDVKAVLVVDDDDDVRQSIAQIVRLGGFIVTEASDGIEAHRLLSTERFDCAIIDIRLPGLDGLTLMSTFPRLPQIILISGQPIDRFPPHWLRFVAAYIEKPVEPQQLLAAVTSVARRAGDNPHEY